MKKIKYIFFLAFLTTLFSCGTSSTVSTETESMNSTVSCTPSEATATYEVTFNATWSADTHPTDFPANAHFSRLIGGTHKSDVTFWKEGELASEGIEAMAERGSVTDLTAEINAAIAAGTAESVLLGSAIALSPGSTSFTFPITSDYHLVTLVSMVAPSPDWFVGVESLDLCENDSWVASKTVSLEPYDSGTDSGVTFLSADDDTSPAEEIAEITGDPFLNEGSVAPLGTFTFVKQ
ncbi:MAG: hypothetical protein COX62_07360 [Deltaproteobacteria bacterium CG_4_10_14_0_2_um_filter_43_8]|nr:MAG: hypothetical protein COV43_07135 [Deltaproteobacteria bacterium CG11_big_fil_rev_8_21_14_0_20_42_23]PJA19062.1 MAG: hypothetical protein COX62_07360 [Deltaproteobacteria bacterium CG_4_10_14_0_2_um_filter_43_8]PJC64169.1 MAG: hypothetical protein CO021_05500 [Deltaproteobacteria bacterium CG_4_9_14_0_2_um_filter_42_21]